MQRRQSENEHIITYHLTGEVANLVGKLVGGLVTGLDVGLPDVGLGVMTGALQVPSNTQSLIAAVIAQESI